DHLHLPGKEVGELALALVAPLGAHDNCSGHARLLQTCTPAVRSVYPDTRPVPEEYGPAWPQRAASQEALKSPAATAEDNSDVRPPPFSRTVRSVSGPRAGRGVPPAHTLNRPRRSSPGHLVEPILQERPLRLVSDQVESPPVGDRSLL